jgi:7 transmembrane receptor (rhodopsin family)
VYEGEQIVLDYMTPPIVALAIVCNLLTIIILGRDETMVSTTSLLLRMLATADLLNVTLILVSTAIPVKEFHYPDYDNVFIPLQSIAFTADAWLEVLICAERYIAVCYPVHINRFATLPCVKAAVVVVWLFALLFNVPRYIENIVVTGYDQVNTYDIAYLVVIRAIFTTLLPFFF